jgi:hypothetical protein
LPELSVVSSDSDDDQGQQDECVATISEKSTSLKEMNEPIIDLCSEDEATTSTTGQQDTSFKEMNEPIIDLCSEDEATTSTTGQQDTSFKEMNEPIIDLCSEDEATMTTSGKKNEINMSSLKADSNSHARYYEGDKELPYIAEAPNYYLESAVQEIFNHEVKRDVCSKQPIGVVTSSTFFVDLSKLEHRADIRSDDLGVWINKGVRSTYSRILFDDDKIKKIVKMPSKPSVMSPSVYRLKRSYWVHAEDHSFQRRLIEIEGTCT